MSQQKRKNPLAERGAGLNVGQMRGIELGVLGAGHMLLNEVPTGRRRYRVFGSGDHQQWHLDRAQLIAEIGIAYRRAVGCIAFG